EDYQIAFCGWLRANNALLQRGSPVSPYGFDTELLERINSNSEDVEQACGSLSSSFTALIAAEPARLAGTVPELVKAGKIDEAIIVNSEALNTWIASDLPTGEYGLSEKVLIDNSKFLKTLKENQLQVLQLCD